MKRCAAPVLAFALLLPVALAAAGAKDIVFKTPWKDRDIVVDGRNEDWQGALGYLADPVIALGFLNDASTLCVCIATNVEDLREGLLRRGLTIWIDPKGGKKKTLGIRLAPSAPLSGPGDRPSGGPPEEAKDKPAPPPGAEPEMRLGPPSRLMVRLPGREDWAPVDGTAGLEAAIEESSGLAVFEMAIPLAAAPGVPVALGAGPGSSVALSFETPKPERPEGRAGRPDDDPSDRVGGRDGFGGPPLGDPMGRPGRGFGNTEPLKEAQNLKLRVTMKLAAGPA